MDQEKGFVSNDTSSNLLQNLWHRSLYSLSKEIDSASKKEIQKKFLQLGHLLSGGDAQDPIVQKRLNLLAEVVEAFQYKASSVRNIDSLMCTEAFDKIRECSFAEQQRLQIFATFLETFSQIRRGQALDSSLRLDALPPKSVREACLKSLELKSGVLISLSLRLGALASPAPACVQQITSFGLRFGIALQMIEDIGSFHIQNRNSKCLEDLRMHRPLWIWAVAAEHGDDWFEFRKAVEALPETKLLEQVLAKSNLRNDGVELAISELKKILRELKEGFDLREDSNAYQVADELVKGWIQTYR